MEILKKLMSTILIMTQFVMLVGVMPARASDPASPNWVCAQDLNNNGYIGDEGEYSQCNIATINNSSTAISYCYPGYVLQSNGTCIKQEYSPAAPACPAGSYVLNGRCVVQTTSTPSSSCPTKTTYYGIWNGQPACAFNGGMAGCRNPLPGIPMLGCARQQITNGAYIYMAMFAPTLYCPSGTLNGSVCTNTSDYGPVQSSCPAGSELINGQCQKTVVSETQYKCEKGTLSGTICQWNTTENYCPIGADATCLANGGGASCSANKCINIDENKPVDEGDIDGSMLVDDGKRDDEGACMDQVFIFSGRAQDCKLAGVSTAFKNCCKSEGKVFTDSAGALGTISTAASTISKVYGAAQEAYTYYTVAMQATGDAAVASSMAAQGFGNAMIVAFDPTSLAISVAIYFAMKYLMKACDQQSMETAMTADSGYCHEVGTYCKKKIPLLGCVQKAKSYCCFNSKLARIIHEQGRPQLKGFNGWGDAGSPACRGFTPDEFSSIDFGQIDLSEYVEDMVKKATSEIQQNVNQITQDFYDKTN